MIVKNVNDTPDTKIESFPYKNKPYPVKDTWIRWLSQAGPEGAPEYGLRLFTVGPKGSIPIHNHLYYQTMYVLTGHLSRLRAMTPRRTSHWKKNRWAHTT